MTEEEYAEQEAFADKVEASLPTYVSHRSRVIAIQALSAINGVHPEDLNYELGRWFDAAIAVASDQRGGA